jgi:hypothetical protein
LVTVSVWVPVPPGMMVGVDAAIDKSDSARDPSIKNRTPSPEKAPFPYVWTMVMEE